MNLSTATVFITGANRGLGLALAREALAQGARKVYVAARNPAGIDLPAWCPYAWTVTSEADIATLAELAPDVNLLINNAGVAEFGGFLSDTSMDAARRQMEVNFFGPLRVTQALAPVLAANGGGAVLNVLSVASWINRPLLGTYGATKSAAWALTNGLRHELREQGTRVSGLHVGFIDTDLTQGIDAPKLDAAQVARETLQAVAEGREEILVGDLTRQVKAGLNAEPPVYIAA